MSRSAAMQVPWPAAIADRRRNQERKGNRKPKSGRNLQLRTGLATACGQARICKNARRGCLIEQMKAHTTLALHSLAWVGAHASTYSTAAKPRVLQISIGIISGISRFRGYASSRSIDDVDGLNLSGTQSRCAQKRRKLHLKQAAIFGCGMSVGCPHGAHSSTR